MSLTSASTQSDPQAPKDDSYVLFEMVTAKELVELVSSGKFPEGTKVLLKRSTRIPKNADRYTKRDNLERAIDEHVGEEDKAGNWHEGKTYAAARSEYYFEKTPKKHVEIKWG